MARRTKRKKKQGSRLSQFWARLREMDAPTVSRAGRITGWCTVAIVVAVAWFVGVPRLGAAVSARIWSDDVSIDFIDHPAWVRGDLLAMLDLTARHQLSGDPLAQHDLVAVHDALMATGWFDGVTQVRRLRTDLVEITAQFVQPAAVIRDADGDHLVDLTGKLLPRTYPHDGAKTQIVVTGVQFTRPPRPGETWEGADITAALRLLRLVRSRPWREQVSALDVSRFLSEKTVVVVTDRDSRLIWGSAPGEERALEVLSRRKLQRLDTAFVELGHIDAGYQGTLDLTNPRGVIGQ